MKLKQARQLAEQTIKEHLDSEWRFQFDEAARRFGYCSYRKKVISLSRSLVELNSLYDVNDTILHEVAHALAGKQAGHGYAWKDTARSIGCSATRTYNSKTIKQPAPKWIATCPNCKREYKRMKRMKSLACAQCCNQHNFGKWSEKYVLGWRKHQ